MWVADHWENLNNQNQNQNQNQYDNKWDGKPSTSLVGLKSH